MNRARRGARESLTSVVLGFEAVIVFLGGLAIHGLRALPATIPSWWGIVAGSLLALVFVAATRFTGKPWGITLGWILQVVVAAGALLVPALLIVALVFGALYAYATIKGGALDQRNATYVPDSNGD